MLSKIKTDKTYPVIIGLTIHPSIELVMKKYFFPNSTYFTSGNIVLCNKSDVSYIVKNNEVRKIIKKNKLKFKCGEYYIWKSIESFHQNNSMIADKIYKTINYLLKFNRNNLWIGIGGEFMYYFINNLSNFFQPEKYIAVTNSESIKEDAVFNNTFYSMNLDINKINYEKIKEYPIITNKALVIIQVANITITLINYLLNNKDIIDEIIFITCHIDNYNKRIVPLYYYYKQTITKYWQNGPISIVGIIQLKRK